jgi:hypothetical protein
VHAHPARSRSLDGDSNVQRFPKVCL